MKETAEFIQILNSLSDAQRRIPNKVAALAVQFSKERFKNQNWLDESPERWKPRKNDPKRKNKRAILVQSGRLKRSIQKVRADANMVLIEAVGVPYAIAHNAGAVVDKTVRVRKHTRTRKGKTYTVHAHKRQSFHRVPKRQFMGASATLNKRMELLITAEFVRAIKNI